MITERIRDGWFRLIDRLDENGDDLVLRGIYIALGAVLAMALCVVFIAWTPFPFWVDLILLVFMAVFGTRYWDNRKTRSVELAALISAHSRLAPVPARPEQAAEYEGEEPPDLESVAEADEKEGDDGPQEAYLPENHSVVKLPRSLAGALADDEYLTVYSRPFPVVLTPRILLVMLALISVATAHTSDTTNQVSLTILVLVAVGVGGLVSVPLFRQIGRLRFWMHEKREERKLGFILIGLAFSLILFAAFLIWANSKGLIPLSFFQAVGSGIWDASVWSVSSWENFTLTLLLFATALLLAKAYVWQANPYAISNRHFWRSFGVLHTEWRKVKLESINDDGFKAPLEKLRLNLPFGTLNIETPGQDDEDFKGIVGFYRKHLKWLTRG